MQPISPEQGFTSLRREGAVYVDKTEIISKLISYKRVFFSRPRRFGKSLTLSTISTLFEKGVDPYFKGTWIYDRWTDGTYPVLRINCLKFLLDDFSGFVKRFCDEIADFADSLELNFKPKNILPGDYIKALFKALAEDQQIVILIDEYDCGLTHNINDPDEYNKYAECLRGFYGVLKGDEHVRFLGITGVTRLKNVSIFSVGSDITDATFDSKLATLTGYTKDELVKYFREYLLDTVNTLYGTTLTLDDITEDNTYVNALLNRLATEYDGYCFDGAGEQKVYSTWSINRFFFNNFKSKEITFGDYWFDNGGMPSILKNYLESHELDVASYLQNDEITPDPEDFLSPTSLLNISSTVLMCQTGYLTLRSNLEANIRLGIPNHEVRKALAKRLYYRFTKRYPEVTSYQQETLKNGSPEEIFKLFNVLFNSLSYENYPIRDEASLRGHLHSFFLGAGLAVIAEHQSSKGRSDLEIEFPKRRIVIELKYVEGSKLVEQSLKQAVTQIKERDYGNTLPLKQELIRLAMVFDGSKEQRRFIAYEKC